MFSFFIVLDDKLHKYFDEINDSFEKLKSVIDKHPKETFRFYNRDGQGWVIEIDVNLLGLPMETTKDSLYKETESNNEDYKNSRTMYHTDDSTLAGVSECSKT